MARKPVKKRRPRKVAAEPVAIKARPKNPRFNLTIGSDTDPFWIDPATIPEGFSLQWSIPTTLDAPKRRGWTPVPNIAAVGGQILTWAPYEVARAQRDAENQRALDQAEAMGSGALNHPVRILSPSFMCSSDYERIATNTPPLDIQVNICLRLSARQLDAASALKLSPQEYGQRIARMMLISPVNVPEHITSENVSRLGLVYGLQEFFPKKDEKK